MPKVKKERNVTSRHWLFTSFADKVVFSDAVRGYTYQREESPETKRLHWQGYVEFDSPVRMAGVKTAIGDNAAHLEIRAGSRAQAIQYCSKTASRVDGPWYFGCCKPGSGGQGERNDLKKIAEEIKTYGLPTAIDANPGAYIKFTRGMESYARHCMPKPPRWRNLSVTTLVGRAGVGKSRLVYKSHAQETIYPLMNPDGGVLWFDGYDRQDVLLIDDFDGWISYKKLLRLLDGYPLQVQVKGSVTTAFWTKVYITSNTPIESWYPTMTDLSALRRRIQHPLLMSGCCVENSTEA